MVQHDTAGMDIVQNRENFCPSRVIDVFYFIQLQNRHDILNIKETRNDELRNRVDNLKYQNTKMKALTDRLEHNLAELLDKIKESEMSACQPEAEVEKNENEDRPLSKTETSVIVNDRVT